MITKMIGLEAEFLFLKKGQVVIPPAYYDRDGFPVLGEIRGEPGKEVHQVLSNFSSAQFKLMDRLGKTESVEFSNCHKIPLKLYKEANRQINYEEKGRDLGKVQNIYGTNLEDFSDQVVSKGKIQGINISCGLHVHFSCEEIDEIKVEEAQFESVNLPLMVGVGPDIQHSTSIQLYKKKGYNETKVLKARASKLNKPTINYIVKAMDEAFFDRFAPPAKQRTKFRQPGFYEMKPYGFEYRSLPANEEVLANLPEIVKFAFKLLQEAS